MISMNNRKRPIDSRAFIFTRAYRYNIQTGMSETRMISRMMMAFNFNESDWFFPYEDTPGPPITSGLSIIFAGLNKPPA